MKKLTDLEYLKLNKFQAFIYNLKMFLFAIPRFFVSLGIAILNFFKNFGISVWEEVVEIATTFTKGNWAVKISFLIFGFGNFYYGQILRGILFLLFEVVFIGYMIVPSGGAYWLSKVNWFQNGATYYFDSSTSIVQRIALVYCMTPDEAQRRTQEIKDRVLHL